MFGGMQRPRECLRADPCSFDDGVINRVPERLRIQTRRRQIKSMSTDNRTCPAVTEFVAGDLGRDFDHPDGQHRTPDGARAVCFDDSDIHRAADLGVFVDLDCLDHGDAAIDVELDDSILLTDVHIDRALVNLFECSTAVDRSDQPVVGVNDLELKRRTRPQPDRRRRLAPPLPVGGSVAHPQPISLDQLANAVGEIVSPERFVGRPQWLFERRATRDAATGSAGSTS